MSAVCMCVPSLRVCNDVNYQPRRHADCERECRQGCRLSLQDLITVLIRGMVIWVGGK